MTRRKKYTFHFTVANGVETLEVEVEGRTGELPAFKLDADGLLMHSITTLAWYIEYTTKDSCDEGLVELLGRYLFELLFSANQQEITVASARRGLMAEFVTNCNQSAIEIRLMFDRRALHFAQLPWELLWIPTHDGGKTGRHIADLPKVAFTLARTVSGQRDVNRATGALRVLHVTYGPREMPTTGPGLAAVLQDLASRTKAVPSTSNLEYHSLTGVVDPAAIGAAIKKIRPHVFHFSGHGERDALWLAKVASRQEFSDIESRRRPLGFDVAPKVEAYLERFNGLRKLFEVFEVQTNQQAYTPELVVLDACSTDAWLAELLPSVTHELVKYVPAVIAMRYPIANDVSISFAGELYGQLAAGVCLDEAVQHARNHIIHEAGLPAARSFRAAGIPVLYLRTSSALCADLIGELPSGPKSSVTVRPELDDDCPYCGKSAMWTPKAVWCVNCHVRFTCSDPSCRAAGGRYNRQQIALAPTICPNCGERQLELPVRERDSASARVPEAAPDQFTANSPATERPAWAPLTLG